MVDQVGLTLGAPADPVQWAKYVSENLDQYVFLDTETTGVGASDQVITIGLAIGGGAAPVKIGMACKPTRPIPAEATRIHGITNERVMNCPAWPEIEAVVGRIVGDRTIIAYNVDFDYRLCAQSHDATLPRVIYPDWLGRPWECAMLKYAEMIGTPHPRREGEYAWHKLQDVCDRYGIRIQNHNAVADAVATRDVVLMMAQESR